MIKKYSQLSQPPLFFRKVKMLGDVIKIPYFAENPEPVKTSEEKVVASQTFNKKGKTGDGKFITAYRVSLMQKGEDRYIQVESGHEVQGSFSGVQVRFEKMKVSDIESDRVADKLASNFWKKYVK